MGKECTYGALIDAPYDTQLDKVFAFQNVGGKGRL